MKHSLIPMDRRENALGWIYFAFQLLALPAILQIVSLYLPLDDVALNCLGWALNLALVIAIFRKYLWQNLLRALDEPFRVLRCALFGFFAYQLLSVLLSTLIVRLAPGFSNVNNSNISQMVQSSYTKMAVGTVLLVPIAEETLYRGLLFDTLHRKSRPAAYAVSAAVFACAHVLGYVGSADWLTLLLCFLQYLPAGLCLGWAYERSGSLVASVLIHMTVNQIGMLSMR